jgi:tight adherence protein B
MTDPMTPVLLWLASLTVAMLGAYQLIRAYTRAREIGWRVSADDPGREILPWYARVDLWFRGTPPGRRLDRALRAGGVRLSPLLFVFLVAAGAVLVRLAATVLRLPDPVPVLLPVAAVAVAALYLHRRRLRRRAMLTAQIADVARALANFTSAGLSLPSAVVAAVAELPEPAATELKLVAQALAVGHSVDSAFGELRQRMPSRELTVLAGTVKVLSRTGGDSAHAMRTISQTLDERREVLDEIQTTLSMSKANAWGVVVLGIGSVLIIRLMAPDALTLLLTEPIGQLAAGAALALFVTGYLLLRRATKIEV